MQSEAMFRPSVHATCRALLIVVLAMGVSACTDSDDPTPGTGQTAAPLDQLHTPQPATQDMGESSAVSSPPEGDAGYRFGAAQTVFFPIAHRPIGPSDEASSPVVTGASDGNVGSSAPGAGPVSATGTLTGEFRQWHKITVSFLGPHADESGEISPFSDYRLDVAFTHLESGRSQVVPGHFAADGNASETGARAGNVWRAHFAPDAPGEWSYRASFREGKDVAVADVPDEYAATAFHGATGEFKVEPSDKSGRDFRGQGLLQYVGLHHLRFAASGEYFLKGGADSPENFLAYFEFDEAKDYGGHPTDLKDGLHRYEPHVRDWRDGDPTWHGYKGKGIIGALNYLASQGMNSVYFLTMNVKGDGAEVFPWTGYDERYRFDVSKLDQWEIVFAHMDHIGLAMHVVLQESENGHLLDKGELGTSRRLYYRELVSRFGHHLAVTWNLSEETTNSTAQRKDFARFIRALDPYSHPITVHTHPSDAENVYEKLVGFEAFEGPSMQSNKISDINSLTRHWRKASSAGGRPWVVTADEMGSPQVGAQPDATDPDRPRLRAEGLWGNLMGGGGGVEWFFGIGHPHNDLDLEDWRTRERLWAHTRHALDFFHAYLPFESLEPRNGDVDGDPAYCFGKEGEIYAVYLRQGGTVTLDMDDVPHPMRVRWYDPRSGGGLRDGTVTTIQGPGEVGIGDPPADPHRDWAVLITRD